MLLARLQRSEDDLAMDVDDESDVDEVAAASSAVRRSPGQAAQAHAASGEEESEDEDEEEDEKGTDAATAQALLEMRRILESKVR